MPILRGRHRRDDDEPEVAPGTLILVERQTHTDRAEGGYRDGADEEVDSEPVLPR